MAVTVSRETCKGMVLQQNAMKKAVVVIKLQIRKAYFFQYFTILGFFEYHIQPYLLLTRLVVSLLK